MSGPNGMGHAYYLQAAGLKDLSKRPILTRFSSRCVRRWCPGPEAAGREGLCRARRSVRREHKARGQGTPEDGRSKDARQRCIGNKGHGGSATVMDSTTHTKVEEDRVEEDQDRLVLTQLTVDRWPDPVLWIRSSGRIVYANDSACETLGYSREELLARKITDLDPDFAEEDLPRRWAKLVQEGSRTFEARLRAKDGVLLSMEVRANTRAGTSTSASSGTSPQGGRPRSASRRWPSSSRRSSSKWIWT